MTEESDQIIFKKASPSEVVQIVEWAAQEGWNPGLADADSFYTADPDGFLLGYRGGQPVACISLVRYTSGFAFLGFYIVKPEFRGQGVGLRIWQAAIDGLDDRVIGLDGVVSQQNNYQKSGFALAHRNIRFGGSPSCNRPSDPRLKTIRPEMVQEVILYDRAIFLADREKFLRAWMQRHAGVAFVDQESIRGYGVVRPCRVGYKIGPLFADTQEAADLLFRALAADAQGEPVFLDCPEPNAEATALAARYGLMPVFETARMYRGGAWNLPLARIFGITTFELG